MTRHIQEFYDRHLYLPAVEQYFERSGFANFGYWDKTTKTSDAASERLTDKLLDMIPEKTGRIVDVACGKGGTTRTILKYYAPENVTAINFSSKQLETAEQHAPGCQFAVMDATQLEFDSESIDNMICVEAAFHFDTREKFLNEALRVLKPGGRLVLSDVLLTEGAEERRSNWHAENYLPDLAAYEALARRVGFSEAEIIDATQECWIPHFWDFVRFAHQKLLDGAFDIQQMQDYLFGTYGIVPELTFYLLASLRK